MAVSSIDELGKRLVRQRLIEPAQLEQSLARLGPSQTGEDLLAVLEAKHHLTSYQVAQIEKGEFDGLVLGGYKLMYRNASGSFARVFRAAAVTDGGMIGLKLLRQRWAKDPATVRQFHREAEVCKRLVHRNIVPIYEVGSQGPFHFFTMEFVEGGNLRDFITIRKQLSAGEATRCVLDMAEGLQYAILQGVTHRDLKMTNVLMGTDGVAKLVDFGLAGDEDISGTSGLGGDGVQRALEYATLEKSTGAPLGDPRSDLFFLGAIYYELLTGNPPWPRTRSREARKQTSRYRNVRPVRNVDPTVPRRVADIVERLMSFNSGDRYQSAAEAVADLKQALAEFGEATSTENRIPPARIAGVNSDTSQQRSRQGDKLTTVMVIEDRPKHQDLLREYLSKRGFRVLVLTDVQRGLDRLTSANPPDCVVLMGESIGDVVVGAFERACSAAKNGRPGCVVVLSEEQTDLATDCEQTRTARVLTQPAQLRDLRREIHLALRRKRDSQPDR